MPGAGCAVQTSRAFSALRLMTAPGGLLSTLGRTRSSAELPPRRHTFVRIFCIAARYRQFAWPRTNVAAPHVVSNVETSGLADGSCFSSPGDSVRERFFHFLHGALSRRKCPRRAPFVRLQTLPRSKLKRSITQRERVSCGSKNSRAVAKSRCVACE